jgi:hypothetical protein
VRSQSLRRSGCRDSGRTRMSARRKRPTRRGPLSRTIKTQLDVALEHVSWATGVVDCCVYATASKLLPRNGRPNLSTHSKARMPCSRKLRATYWKFWRMRCRPVKMSHERQRQNRDSMSWQRNGVIPTDVHARGRVVFAACRPSSSDCHGVHSGVGRG